MKIDSKTFFSILSFYQSELLPGKFVERVQVSRATQYHNILGWSLIALPPTTFFNVVASTRLHLF